MTMKRTTIDLCHYDSDKSYVGRMWAYGLLWEALEPGGFFVSYDTGAKYVGVLRKK